MTEHELPHDAAVQPRSSARSTALIITAMIGLALYVPLTWSGPHDTWIRLAGAAPFTMRRTLLIAGNTALWVSPVLGLATVLHLGCRRCPPADLRSRMVLAYLQSLALAVVVAAAMTAARVILPSDADLTPEREQGFAITIAAAGVIACAGINSLARLASASRPEQTDSGFHPTLDLRSARRTCRSAGACGLTAAFWSDAGSFVQRLGASVVFAIAATLWWTTTGPPIARQT